jgi:hypothetical protein
MRLPTIPESRPQDRLGLPTWPPTMPCSEGAISPKKGVRFGCCSVPIRRPLAEQVPNAAHCRGAVGNRDDCNFQQTQNLAATVSNLNHPCGCVQTRTLQRLNERHLRPIIEKLQEPMTAISKRQIRQRDINSLTTLKDLMGPFIREFSQTAHALRRQAFQVLLDCLSQVLWTAAMSAVPRSAGMPSACIPWQRQDAVCGPFACWT